MNLEKALKIPALMSEGEMAVLATLAADRRRIVEIGSWQGASARAIADNTQGVLYCVDTWQDDAYGSAPAETTRIPHWLHLAFLTHNYDHIRTGKVVPFRATSIQGAMEMRGMKFDMIFIDADHSYHGVHDDIQAWLPLLEEDGILCGHDCYPAGTHHPGVRQAVEELIPKFRVEGTIWIAESM
jgi:predicted O-methyltransferase YrrM